jgi:hypothetical protein
MLAKVTKTDARRSRRQQVVTVMNIQRSQIIKNTTRTAQWSINQIINSQAHKQNTVFKSDTELLLGIGQDVSTTWASARCTYRAFLKYTPTLRLVYAQGRREEGRGKRGGEEKSGSLDTSYLQL